MDSRDDQDPCFWFRRWHKGHGPLATHIYRESGAYRRVILKVGRTIIERCKITMEDHHPRALPKCSHYNRSAPLFSTTPQEPASLSSIILTEVFPNPGGRDTDEFIELFNAVLCRQILPGGQSNFGGKNRSALLPTILQPKQYWAVSKKWSFRQLRNTSEELLL